MSDLTNATQGAPSGGGAVPNTNIIGHSNVTVINRGDGNETRIGNDNRNNQGVIVNIGNTIHPDPGEILNSLRRAPAYYDSSLRKQAQQCMQETRVAILNLIYEWVDGVENPPIFWLYGQAGTGKSTIAHTVAAEYRNRRRLGASFFFAHANAECSDANLFFSTIAYQLSKFDSELRQHIIDGVTAHPSPQDASIPTQFEEFILTPLSKLSSSPVRDQIIVVVDAFDECSDARKASEILQLLLAKIPNFRLRLKFFITSRPEPEIRSILHPDIDSISRSFDLLQDIGASSTDEDIKRFLRFHLEMIGKEYDLLSWPRETDVESLAQQAGGLFIFAHTATEFIKDKDVMDPESQLAMLKNMESNGTPTFNLNALYSRILQKAVPETARVTVQERVIAVVHAIVGLRGPLALCATERLLSFDHGAIRSALSRLRSIFIVPDNGEDTLQVIHPSFSRYITDEGSCTEKRFSVGSRQLQSQLAKYCLRQMKDRLKRNICNFDDFPMVEAPIKDEARSDASLQILSEELKYSCENFAAHVYSADQQDGELCAMVAEWANQYLPYWLEVFALIGSFHNTLPSLRLLAQFFETQTLEFRLQLLPEGARWMEPSQLLGDAIRMVSEFYDDIKRFPYQIYACLAFCPLDSMLFKQYHQLSTVRVICGERNNWTPLLHAFKDPDSDVVSLAFSPDDTMLASCSSSRKILLWDLETGEGRLLAHQTLPCDTSLTFSPDGKYLAAGGDVYRVATGEEVLAPGHCSAFSPDGLYVALGCANGIIRVHEMQGLNLPLLSEFFAQRTIVKKLAFSSDNKFLAAASSDNTIHVWSCSSREIVKQIPCPYPDGYLTFSPNGKRVASTHYLNYTYVWVADIQTGDAHSIKVSGHFPFRNIQKPTFSTSGDSIALLCDNRAGTVIKWVESPRTLVFGDSEPTFPKIPTFSPSVFTPDEKNLLVGDAQGLIRSWRVLDDGQPMNVVNFESKAHAGAVRAITFSHNNKYFASASVDGSIHVWDFTSAGLHEPNLTQNSVFDRKTVVFSPDGETIALVSGPDSTVYKINAKTGVSNFHTNFILDGGNNYLIFSIDGKYLANNNRQQLLLWNTESQHILERAPWRTWTRFVAHAFSPDATYYAVLCFNGSIWVYNLRNGESRQMAYPDCRREFAKLKFSYDSKHLVSCSGDICMFVVENGARMDLKFPVQSYVSDCAFSPCGRYAAIAHDKGLDILEYLAIEPNASEVHSEGSYYTVEYSPDAKFILANANFQLDLFHSDTLEKLFSIKIWSLQNVYHAMREFRRTGRLLDHPSFQPCEYKDFPYLLDKDGWVITASSKRLCRLPVANRGNIYDVNGNRIVVVSSEGKVTLIQLGMDPVCIPTPPVEYIVPFF